MAFVLVLVHCLLGATRTARCCIELRVEDYPTVCGVTVNVCPGRKRPKESAGRCTDSTPN